MWRPIAMCLAVGWMVGCGGAGEPVPDPEPRTQQAGEARSDEIAAPLRDPGPPEWDGTPCDGSGALMAVEGTGYLVPVECEPDYVEKGTPAAEVNPAPEMGWES